MPAGNLSGVFASTHWSVVQAAQKDDPSAREALQTLCEAYWPPLYCFVRRAGHDAHGSEDLTQGFFAWLLAAEQIEQADPAHGRFRSFLLVRLKYFLSDERKRSHAQKRGGGKLVSLDAALAEGQYSAEPRTTLTPERLYERRWALTLLDRALERLRLEYARAGKAELFERLKEHQPGSRMTESYEATAAALGLTVSAVKSAVFRFRQRHREILRDEVGQTVCVPEEIDDEIRYLLSMFGDG